MNQSYLRLLRHSMHFHWRPKWIWLLNTSIKRIRTKCMGISLSYKMTYHIRSSMIWLVHWEKSQSGRNSTAPAMKRLPGSIRMERVQQHSVKMTSWTTSEWNSISTSNPCIKSHHCCYPTSLLALESLVTTSSPGSRETVHQYTGPSTTTHVISISSINWLPLNTQILGLLHSSPRSSMLVYRFFTMGSIAQSNQLRMQSL